jgi:predicted Zn-dependent protease with MMP-like domain
VHVDRATFEDLVRQAMAAVPQPFARILERVAVVVEERTPPGEPDLYGLYMGAPFGHEETAFGVLPPRIAIYMHPLMDDCRTHEDLVEEVRVTLLHELGHHLGMDERQLRELGYG